MRTIVKSLMLLLTLIFFSTVTAVCQVNITQDSTKIFLVTKNDGTEFLGEVLTSDAREVLIRTENIGDVYVPKHEIKSIKEVNPKFYEEFSGEELFATRYFITTNGLPIKKGENYIQWNIYGPDFQFGIADNFGVGIMTSWAAIPIIANAKYSIKLGEKTSMALGALAGTGSWALPDFGLALPYASFTYGNRRNNINLSAGYGAIFYKEENYNPITDTSFDEKFIEGRVLLSIAGMAKINSKLSLVFDSFISPLGQEHTRTVWEDRGSYNDSKEEYVPNWVSTTVKEKSPSLAIILPGIRWQMDANKAFQFGFTGCYYDGEFVPFPVPMIQWYRKL
jgi:hypothetical protein